MRSAAGKSTGKDSGQGLVEFLVIVPVAAFFLAAIPILLSGVIQPLWIQELLYTCALIPGELPPIEELSSVREGSMLPKPFRREDILTRSTQEFKRAPRYSLHRYYPGSILRIEAEARPTDQSSNAGKFSLDSIGPPPNERRISLLALRRFVPPGVKDELRSVTVGGAVPTGLAERLRRFGIEAVSLNLNALPHRSPGRIR
ncbi:MAG: hypothetical protein JSV26_06055 [bacterium]|nr:MAG: hypothetical protein JSV26_06055 [bacterium]